MIQSDVLNDAKISTVIILAITSSLKFGELPGTVVLNKGEANLPRRCVANVTQIKSVGKRNIKEKIVSLPKKRLQEIDTGLKLVLNLTSLYVSIHSAPHLHCCRALEVQ